MDQRISITWVATNAFAPDRLRSLLEFVSRSSLLHVKGLPPNLYNLSETLSKEGGRLDISVDDDGGQQLGGILQANRDNGAALSFSLGPAATLVRSSPLIAAVDLLAAGARMLAADRGMVAVESTPGIAPMPIATWLSPSAAAEIDRSRIDGIAQEQWDGALLILPESPTTSVPRQAIRVIMATEGVDQEALTLAIRNALSSSDWEVRASAMLGAARGGLQSLGMHVKRMEIPQRGPGGVTGDVRRMLLAMQKASLVLLSCGAIPETSAEAPDNRPGMQAHLLRSIAGLPLRFYDDFSLLTTALTQPLPLVVPQPAILPCGLDRDRNGVYRSRSLEFIWVPPIVHWLGAGTNVRQQTPAQGYFLARWPLRSSNSNEYLQTSFARAREVAEEFSSSEGLALAIPTADEWEMAVRGPDARLFPWGNGWEKEMLSAASPWGMRDCAGIVGQWSADGLVCGAARDPRCAARSRQESTAAIRLKIDSQVPSSSDTTAGEARP
ncbi:MAG: hypothetical protein AUH11_12110 [Acidobacteria bacterium 13_2_20CM_57_17]|nr:MAG: hypothetical protein AUH11_12110 [Acidobacteria bacterium 13_2_20CM_57_17]OLB95609.1 MAG: hypothetical protein AUI02_03380 [Acidobacteria bacterium 13_2_20CM_2_57_12]OLE16045.1 MAG: hypothetical protein AUG83_04525 [Acidobacteria bacterium 13_1_20CM_4_57_11]